MSAGNRPPQFNVLFKVLQFGLRIGYIQNEASIVLKELLFADGYGNKNESIM